MTISSRIGHADTLRLSSYGCNPSIGIAALLRSPETSTTPLASNETNVTAPTTTNPLINSFFPFIFSDPFAVPFFKTA